jgi:thiamine-phosphate pyrophosphorylase
MTELYVIVDPEHCADHDPLWVAEQALDGGAAVLQLRMKRANDGQRYALAHALAALARERRVPLWINDRADLALACGAAGLHLGQDDLPLAVARELLPRGTLLGLSTHGLAQARAAEASGADWIGLGPIFTTRSKADAEPCVGAAALAEVCRSVSIPVVAIGGITADDAARVARAGARYAAVISAVCSQPSPRDAARRLVEALQSA